MENSNASTVDYSSGMEAMKKAKPHIESGYSSMDEDNYFKVEYGETVYVAGSDDEWIKPKNERKHSTRSPERKNLCGRLAVVGIHSPSRHNMSDGAASSSEMSPGASNPSRSCTQCGATKTPLWRNGPSGPKSLCNACGIRYKKVGGRRGSSSSEPHDSCHQSGKSSSKSPKRKAEADISAPVERSGPHGHRRTRLLVREKREAEEKASCHGHMVFQQSPPVVIPRRVCTRRSLPAFHTPKWGSRSARFSAFRKSQTKDEEEGAALLMALACGLVNA